MNYIFKVTYLSTVIRFLITVSRGSLMRNHEAVFLRECPDVSCPAVKNIFFTAQTPNNAAGCSIYIRRQFRLSSGETWIYVSAHLEN